MEDANEDEDKGCVDEKAGRQVGERGFSHVARAMTPSPFRAPPRMVCTDFQYFTATTKPNTF